jgi:glycosyltransferase involved in cell wall biosynthesis
LESADLPFVSVIVPAKNVELFIEGCLVSIRSNSYPQDRYEIIVVDNGSLDNTRLTAAKHADLVLEMSEGTISAVRNFGSKHSRGTVIAFIDADCLAREDWLMQGVTSLLAEPCVCGCQYDVPENGVWIEHAWYSQRDNGRIEVPSLGAGNMFVPRTVFLELGGFDETLVTGEDTEFCIRSKRLVKVVSDDRIRVIHLGNPKTLMQFFRREIWYGLGAFGSFRVDWKDKPLWGTIGFLLFTVLQVFGLFWWAMGNSVWFFLSATLFLLLLVAGTVVYRRKYVESFTHAAALFVLYYLYYLGRSCSFYYLLSGRGFYHRNRKTKDPHPLSDGG